MKTKNAGVWEAVVNAAGVLGLFVAVIAVLVITDIVVDHSVDSDGEEWGGVAYREWCAGRVAE